MTDRDLMERITDYSFGVGIKLNYLFARSSIAYSTTAQIKKGIILKFTVSRR